MRPPDFFIVGAPKCGTTSLATWLGEHPAIFMSPIKEPWYFCFDHPPRHPLSWHQYLKLFARASSFQICGEASTSYLYSDVAIPEILTVNPRAKIIVMLRNPIEMAPALHAQKRLDRVEDIECFQGAWRLSDKRDRWLDYKQACSLGEQLRRVKSLVPDEQLHIVVLDDLAADSESVYSDALLFLGLLPETEPLELKVLNARKEYRSQWLEGMLRHPPAPLGWLKRKALNVSFIRAKNLRRRITAMNSRPVERRPIDATLRREMEDYFADDIDLLGKLIDRDLSHWIPRHRSRVAPSDPVSISFDELFGVDADGWHR